MQRRDKIIVNYVECCISNQLQSKRYAGLSSFRNFTHIRPTYIVSYPDQTVNDFACSITSLTYSVPPVGAMLRSTLHIFFIACCKGWKGTAENYHDSSLWPVFCLLNACEGKAGRLPDCSCGHVTCSVPMSNHFPFDQPVILLINRASG